MHFVFCVLVSVVAVCHGFEEVVLDGVDWLVTNRNGSISIPGTVPGTAHTALMKADILTAGDPYYRFNELTYSWIAEDDWTFSKVFTVDEESHMLAGDQVVMLEFDSIDTVASVFLNGVQLKISNADWQDPEAPVSNMHTFLRFIVDEGTFGDRAQLLKSGKDANLLEVKIRSPFGFTEARSELYPYEVPMTHFYNVWDDNYTSTYGGNRSSNFNYLRKTASDFGWDWGPAYVPQGIMGRVSLVTFAVGLCRPAITVMQHHLATGAVSLDVATVVFATAASPPQAGGGKVYVTITKPDSGAGGGGITPVASVTVPVGNLAVGENPVVVSLEVQKEDVELWWPNGYGSQPLYTVEVCYEDPFGTKQTHRKKLGLRTAVLRTDPVTKPNMWGKTGESFFFEINGLPIYAKGANWIPADVFSDRVETERIDWLLQSAVDANMNMVRVWGGGFYQPDVFYELADAKGLMIWQEIMFACALYPTDEPFLASVRAEVKHQVTRLQHHASIVIWGGNNENEYALMWYAVSKNNRELYKKDYVKLYIDTVHAAVKEVDPMVGVGRGWVDSSPSNGLVTEEPYVKRWQMPNLWEYGDVHHYDYFHDCEDYKVYPQPRFVSEHGFQSWPAFAILKNLTEADDWSRDSAFFDYRQRHQNGNMEMLGMMLRHYRIPEANASTARDVDPLIMGAGSKRRSAEGDKLRVTDRSTQQALFDAYLYLSQVQQARCYETSIGLWRRLKSDEAVQTMGILYWQLNDIWPGPSWSTMEYDGRWRVAHYSVQRMYAPLLISSFTDPSDTVRTHLTSDRPRPTLGRLEVHLHAWAATDSRPLATWHHAVELPALGSSEVAARSASEYLNSRGAHTDRASAARRSLLAGAADHHLSANKIDNSPKSMFLRMVLKEKGGVEEVESFHFFTALGAASLPDTEVTIEAVERVPGSDASATVTVRAPMAAVYVLLETTAASGVVGKFSENAFVLMPGRPKQVVFTARRSIPSLETLRKALQVRSLRDTYA